MFKLDHSHLVTSALKNSDFLISLFGVVCRWRPGWSSFQLCWHCTYKLGAVAATLSCICPHMHAHTHTDRPTSPLHLWRQQQQHPHHQSNAKTNSSNDNQNLNYNSAFITQKVLLYMGEHVCAHETWCRLYKRSDCPYSQGSLNKVVSILLSLSLSPSPSPSPSPCLSRSLSLSQYICICKCIYIYIYAQNFTQYIQM